MRGDSGRLAVGAVLVTGRCAVLRVSGELDYDSERRFLEEAGAFVTQGRQHLVLDLTALSFCDSRGLNCLLALEWLCRRQDGRLLLASAGTHTRRLLEQTGTDRTFACFPTVGHALAAVPAEHRPVWPPTAVAAGRG
ncbi:MAG TPA: STAS domain-containing protein [Streptomyces sp.]|nr:STAS domain-containing protein [Streptomyces sp.]